MGELLGVARVGRQDNFFELGGHSLLAVKLITRIRDTLDVDMGLTDLFASPELESLAEYVMKQKMTQIDEHELAELAIAAGYDASELEAMLATLSTVEDE
ncbi:phosphopantetheine-binding protein [Vibrio sp. PP-XX7]